MMLSDIVIVPWEWQEQSLNFFKFSTSTGLMFVRLTVFHVLKSFVDKFGI